MNTMYEFNGLNSRVMLGDTLYVIKSKGNKSVYAPCPTCNNARAVDFIGADNVKYTMPCPRCTGMQTKGDKSRFITLTNYEITEMKIIELKLTNDKKTGEEFLCISTGYYSHNDLRADIFEPLVRNNSSENAVTAFTDIKEARAELKRLMSIERKKEEAFLAQFKQNPVNDKECE